MAPSHKRLKTVSLDGRESSVLALLAQAPHLSNNDRRRIMSTLNGDALEIAKAIVGGNDVSALAKRAAKYFVSWARTLRERRQT